jgi:hypothetical protein
MTLLLVRLPGDNGYDILWPWEQDAELRRDTVLHTSACHLCEMRAGSTFGTEVPKSTFTPCCTVGVELGHALCAYAATKRATK